MLILSTIDPNTLDLNYFYSKCRNSLRVAFFEEFPNDIHSLLTKSKPNICLIRSLHSNTQNIHFLLALQLTAISTCLCGKYHTKFIANNNQTYTQTIANSTLITTNPNNKKTKQLLNDLSNLLKISFHLLLHISTNILAKSAG